MMKIAKFIRLLVGSAALLVGFVFLNAERMKPVLEWIKRVQYELSPLTDFMSRVVDVIKRMSSLNEEAGVDWEESRVRMILDGERFRRRKLRC